MARGLRRRVEDVAQEITQESPGVSTFLWEEFSRSLGIVTELALCVKYLNIHSSSIRVDEVDEIDICPPYGLVVNYHFVPISDTKVKDRRTYLTTTVQIARDWFDMDHITEILPVLEVILVCPVKTVELFDQRILEVLMRLFSLCITSIPAEFVTQTIKFM